MVERVAKIEDNTDNQKGMKKTATHTICLLTLACKEYEKRICHSVPFIDYCVSICKPDALLLL